MSRYTPELVTELEAQDSWTFEDAAKFADINNLSTRSVVSKIKSLKINYVPKAKVVSTSAPRITKADLVSTIVTKLGGSHEELEGLENANLRSLAALLKIIS